MGDRISILVDVCSVEHLLDKKTLDLVKIYKGDKDNWCEYTQYIMPKGVYISEEGQLVIEHACADEVEQAFNCDYE